uniref:Myb-like domain-containing protein n=1 Tax=Nelumbo nucifera TaxID=4432 RepID=A0A822YTJ1_NELNU|nr:TPA_asm: hypothetical protein HUJ06_004736 [Nelumbo nucifera]
MAHEQLSPPPPPVDGDPNAVPVSNGVDAADDSNRPPRLPRWTRQEILILIQGKKVAENRVRRGRASGSAFGSSNLEPKWASVSSYCKRHGVNREPVQCRKRWSNLAGDFKKIKEWESQIKEEAESFWAMRNDLRRERKLPGFFDREVYDILTGGTGPITELAVTTDGKSIERAPTVVKEEEKEAVFYSGRSAAADGGLFSDFEPPGQEEAGGESEKETAMGSPARTIPAPVPISEKQYQPFSEGYLHQVPQVQQVKSSLQQILRKGPHLRRLRSGGGCQQMGMVIPVYRIN